MQFGGALPAIPSVRRAHGSFRHLNPDWFLNLLTPSDSLEITLKPRSTDFFKVQQRKRIWTLSTPWTPPGCATLQMARLFGVWMGGTVACLSPPPPTPGQPSPCSIVHRSTFAQQFSTDTPKWSMCLCRVPSIIGGSFLRMDSSRCFSYSREVRWLYWRPSCTILRVAISKWPFAMEWFIAPRFSDKRYRGREGRTILCLLFLDYCRRRRRQTDPLPGFFLKLWCPPSRSGGERPHSSVFPRAVCLVCSISPTLFSTRPSTAIQALMITLKNRGKFDWATRTSNC